MNGGCTRTDFTLDGRRCVLYACPQPEVLLVEPVDENDLAFLDRETEYLAARAVRPFALATFLIADWNRELTPWKAEAVFGREPFGDGAPQTLSFVTETLLPHLRDRFPSAERLPVVLGGYSLAAFFALWAGYVQEGIDAVAAASPSVWYPGWMDFARTHVPKARRISLSLGDAEERTRNRVMATVGDCIREQAALLDARGVANVLEWNPGNHFKDTDVRTAKAFLRALEGPVFERETQR